MDITKSTIDLVIHYPIKQSRFLVLFLVISMVTLIACDPFTYSPYEIPNTASDETDINPRNLDLIAQSEATGSDTFSFAIISDTHIEYDDLSEAVDDINKQPGLRFVLHLGDATDGGLYNEFHWTNNVLTKLNIPYLVIFGNHDCLSHGKMIYKRMYGPDNFAFTYKNSNFVCFNNINWEDELVNPDLNWLDSNLAEGEMMTNRFVFAHFPAFCHTFSDAFEQEYVGLMDKHHVKCSFHGHSHYHYFGRHYPGHSTYFFISEDIKDRIYHVITVADTNLLVETKIF